jgi:predicted nuclease with TOPRIM domain
MTELDEYNDKDEDDDDDEDETPQNSSQKAITQAMTVDEYNKYEESKIINEKLQNENKEVYKKLLKSNEQITNLVNIVMDKFNIENITMELEDHKSQIIETNIKKSNKIKKHNKRIDEFVDSIELF